uniref:CYTH domain-containing protein n=1 Tax=Chlamydomonas leiostraca TaxID=1034604 RepID=A0A7S0S2Q8_9CHLO|mmetsp:Transcript_5563/g.13865  ORF Transcript_5563/g.13865 Transcript_5563/m.13865 type:complete len:716 (+) Transcript_5563:46-2193(+)
MSLRREGASSPAPEPRSQKSAGGKKLLKEVLELEQIRTKDGRTRFTIKNVEETLTFDKGFYVFVRALQMLKAHNEGVVLVGLAGPSGSGKTAFSEKVKTFMPGVVVISMDMYNDGSKVVDQNYDDPRLTDYDTLLANLADLKAGRETQVPIYDFRVSKRVGYTPVGVPESRVIVLEGIYALSDKLKPLLDLRVSIAGGVHFDLVKRVMRDIHRSGQQPEEIIQQITDTVYPMFKAYIEPNLNSAQLRINNAFNPFSGFMHPTYILKSARVPDMEVLKRELEAMTGGAAVESRDVDLIDIYLLPPNEDMETCQSWLRMRNRDGKYSLMFEEWVTEEPFIISPRITFEVGVRVLGGLMALGYEIGAMMRRTSAVLRSGGGDLTVKVDDIEGLGRFVQLLGRDRDRVRELGTRLGLDGSYIARSYIEQVQLDKLTSEFAAGVVSAEIRDKIAQHSATEALQEIFAASPPYTRGGGQHPRRYSLAGMVGLGTSAPTVITAAPIATASSAAQLTAALNNVANLPASGAPSGPIPMRPPPGLLHQALNSSDGAAGPLNHSSANSPIPIKRLMSGFQPTPVGTPPAGFSHNSNHSYGPKNATDAVITDYVAANTAGASLSRAVDKLDSKLTTITASMQSTQMLQVQLDAMCEQYKSTNQQLVELSKATATLAASLQGIMAQQQQQAQQSSSWGAAVPGWALALGAVATGAAAVAAFVHMRRS